MSVEVNETETPAADAKPVKPQTAVLIPRFAAAKAREIGSQLDEPTRHVFGAAILAFAELEPTSQVELTKKSRTLYRDADATADES